MKSIQPISETNNIELLSVAKQALSVAQTLPDVSSVIDKAELIQLAAKKAKLSLEAQNDWAAFKTGRGAQSWRNLERDSQESRWKTLEKPISR